MAEPALKLLTFDELEALEDRDGLRYELWGDEPVAMTGGTPAHNLIALALARTIHPQLKGTPCRVFMADVGLRLSESVRSNKAYPDVMIVCNPKPETYQTAPVCGIRKAGPVLSQAPGLCAAPVGLRRLRDRHGLGEQIQDGSGHHQ